MLARIAAAVDKGQPAQALEALDRWAQSDSLTGDDEALWLYGRIYEANGPHKDVARALRAYKRILSDYPQSPRWAEAQRRARYLERYYLEIR